MARARTPRPRPHPRAHAGVTFLEVVFATAILAVGAAAMTSAFGLSDRLSAIDQDRLNAMEVAHRVVLQAIDNPTSLDPDKPYPLGRGVYRYLITQEVVSPEATGARSAEIREKKHAKQASFQEIFQSRLFQVKVEVYKDEDGRRGEIPLATLTRVYDILINPDEDMDAFIDNLVNATAQQPELQLLLKQFQFSQQQQRGATAPGAAPSTPAAAPQDAPRQRREFGKGPRRVRTPTE